MSNQTQETLDLGIAPPPTVAAPPKIEPPKVFIVDYLDQIKVRDKKAYVRDVARYNASWTHNPPARSERVFEASADAAAFIVTRAEAAVTGAKTRVKYAEARLRKCQRKFNGGA